MLYTSAGELISEQPLPAEIPILTWQRWTWLPFAPVLDVILIPIALTAIVLLPVELLRSD